MSRKRLAKRRKVRSWGQTRPDARLTVVDSNRNIGFLYDERHSHHLSETLALADAFNLDAAASSDALRRIATDGTAVVFEMQDNKQIALEFIVGPPLTDEEMASLPWLQPQRALLRVPSGRLRLDSVNTLPAAMYLLPPYPGTPTEKPGFVDVTPGDYVVTLHRVDVEAAERRYGIEVDGPDAIVTLTKRSESSEPIEALPILRYEGNADLSWPGQYTIEQNRFSGLVLFQGADSQLILNLDRDAARSLGVGAGVGLKIVVSTLGMEMHAFVTADECTEAISPPLKATLRAMRAFNETGDVDRRLFPRDKAAGEWLRAAEWYRAFGVRLPQRLQHIELLRFFRLGEGTSVPGELQSEWLPADVQVLPRPQFPASYLERLAVT